MLRNVVLMSRSLIVEGQHAVLGVASVHVPIRCNSTMVATEAGKQEWDYAKPFDDIPGPKPLPIIGNVWRFIPRIGKQMFCFFVMLLIYARKLKDEHVM
jgi:hypothetical protein